MALRFCAGRSFPRWLRADFSASNRARMPCRSRPRRVPQSIAAVVLATSPAEAAQATLS